MTKHNTLEIAMTTTHDGRMACVLGALLADAATLGLHWIYEPERIKEICANYLSAAFVPIDQSNYENVMGYFAHEQRTNGQLSQYGETLHLAVQTFIKHKTPLNVAAYQKAYLGAFGMGGSYSGYIDRPTSGTVKNIMAEQNTPSGVEDDQHPAIARLPAVVSLAHDLKGSQRDIIAAIEITNLGNEAQEYGLAYSKLLHLVLNGSSISDAMQSTADQLPGGEMKDKLLDALKTTETDSIKYGEVTERACHLSQGLPLSFHILRHATSYKNAIELNIRAGGDNCGRALMIGSVWAASEGTQCLPTEWLLQLQDGQSLWQECDQLANLINDSI